MMQVVRTSLHTDTSVSLLDRHPYQVGRRKHTDLGITAIKSVDGVFPFFTDIERGHAVKWHLGAPTDL